MAAVLTGVHCLLGDAVSITRQCLGQHNKYNKQKRSQLILQKPTGHILTIICCFGCASSETYNIDIKQVAPDK